MKEENKKVKEERLFLFKKKLNLAFGLSTSSYGLSGIKKSRTIKINIFYILNHIF